MITHLFSLGVFTVLVVALAGFFGFVIRREEAEVTKKPYIKEVVVKEKAVTNNKEITEDVTSEELIDQILNE